MTSYTKSLKDANCYKFSTKVFVPLFKILPYSSSVCFHPHLLPLPKILHNSTSSFPVFVPLFVTVLPISSVLSTHWNSISPSKTIPIAISSIKSFWLISKCIFLFFETPQHFLLLLWHLLQSAWQKCYVYHLPSSPPNRRNSKLPTEENGVSLILVCSISLTQGPESRRVLFIYLFILFIFLQEGALK